MPVAVNGASFPQRITGVQRYAREITSRLLVHDDVRLLLPGPPGNLAQPASLPSGARVDVVTGGITARSLGPWGWATRDLPRALAPDEVVWSPTIRAPLLRRRHVLSVHDLAVLDHPEWFRPAVVAQWRILLAAHVRSVHTIITDSVFSAGRLMSRLGLRASQVEVVPCGVDARFLHVSDAEVARVRQKHGLPEVFVLSVSSVDPRKNLGLLLRAWSLLPRQVPLVLVGGPARNFRAGGLLDGLPPGVQHLGYVDDDDLPALYAAAAVFAYPSAYEGFGLPPLEAMAAGAPVLGLASTPAVVEVVGDTGVLVPSSVEAICHGLAELLEEDTRELTNRARTRAATFSWERSAGGVLAVLRTAARDGA